MSTTARIAILQKDLIVRSVYCHDGDSDFLAPQLLMYYKTPQRVKDLIDLGDLSQVGKKISINESSVNDRVTISYHRDRGEKKNISHYRSYEDFLCDYKNKQDFNFLFVEKSENWYLLDYKSNKKINLNSIVKKAVKHMSPILVVDYQNYLKELEIIKNSKKLNEHLYERSSVEASSSSNNVKRIKI